MRSFKKHKSQFERGFAERIKTSRDEESISGRGHFCPAIFSGLAPIAQPLLVHAAQRRLVPAGQPHLAPIPLPRRVYRGPKIRSLGAALATTSVLIVQSQCDTRARPRVFRRSTMQFSLIFHASRGYLDAVGSPLRR